MHSVSSVSGRLFPATATPPKVRVLYLPGAGGAERTHSVAMLYTSALPD